MSAVKPTIWYFEAISTNYVVTLGEVTEVQNEHVTNHYFNP